MNYRYVFLLMFFCTNRMFSRFQDLSVLFIQSKSQKAAQAPVSIPAANSVSSASSIGQKSETTSEQKTSGVRKYKKKNQPSGKLGKNTDLETLLHQNNQIKQTNTLYQQGVAIVSNPILKKEYQQLLFNLYLFFESFSDQILYPVHTSVQKHALISFSDLLDLVTQKEPNVSKKSPVSLSSLLNVVSDSHAIMKNKTMSHVSLKILLNDISVTSEKQTEKKVSLLALLDQPIKKSQNIVKKNNAIELSSLLTTGN